MSQEIKRYDQKKTYAELMRKNDEKILEIFKDKYSVTKDGKILSHYVTKAQKKRAVPHEMSLRLNGGYVVVNIFNQYYKVHRIITLLNYGLPPHPRMVAGHINDIKTDNRVENLKWMTVSENSKSAVDNKKIPAGVISWTSKVNYDDLFKIHKLAREGVKASDIASEFKIHTVTVQQILKGISHKKESEKINQTLGPYRYKYRKKILNEAEITKGEE